LIGVLPRKPFTAPEPTTTPRPAGKPGKENRDMKQTLTTDQAANLLVADTNAGWSYAGARALVEHLEATEEDTGEEIEFDRVALRCEFSEYASALEAADEYGFEPDEDADSEDAIEEAALEWLNDRTMVVAFDGGVIVRQF
jgi:hypothetical protein